MLENNLATKIVWHLLYKKRWSITRIAERYGTDNMTVFLAIKSYRADKK